MSEADVTTHGTGLITCRQCGNDVPRLEYCIRCGDPLSDEYGAEAVREQRSRFAAAPNEGLNAPALISTFFPQLPRAEMRAFRLAFAAGLLIIVALALLGFYPVALFTAAVFVPLLMVIYLYDVDIYEDEPLWVYGATMLWGALAGVVYGFALNAMPATSAFGQQNVGQILLIAVGLPIVEAALMLAGPIVLLRWRRFNDVLDGATFAAASAVSFIGAHLIIQALPLAGAGLRPAGDPLPWVVQLISLGVLQPVIAAGAIGAVGAALWLRYRAPVTDRGALGPVGNPVIALIGALALLIIAGLAKVTLSLIPATIVLAVIALVALLWLRRALHLGLLQESREIAVERQIRCANCGRTTPEHTFCGQCGIALRALPRSARTPAADQAAGPVADR